jgi:enoyl-[acyl-carrier-protein] reductase (NADH)
VTAEILTQKLREKRVLVNQISANAIRCLTHKDVVRDDILLALRAIRNTVSGH